MDWVYHSPTLLNHRESPPKAFPKVLWNYRHDQGLCFSSTTGYGFWAFPPEVRNRIYRCLLKAPYTGAGWHTS